MDVLERRIPGYRPGFDVGEEGTQAADQRLGLIRGQDAGAGQAVDVGDRTSKVVRRERLVDFDGSTEVSCPGVGLPLEPPTPHLQGPATSPSCRQPLTKGGGDAPASHLPEVGSLLPSPEG